jgi:hypothetical protein
LALSFDITHERLPSHGLEILASRKFSQLGLPKGLVSQHGPASDQHPSGYRHNCQFLSDVAKDLLIWCFSASAFEDDKR